MIYKLRRLIKLLIRVIRHSDFKNLPERPVLIFDADTAAVLENLILNGLKYVKVNTRGTKFNISFPILFNFYKNLYKYPKHLAYYIAYIDVIKPKVVITYTDNSDRFHAISQLRRGPSYHAVQNGGRDMRTESDISANQHVNMDNFWCFGQFEKDLFKNFGDYTVQKYHTIGSIRLSYFRSIIAPLHEKKQKVDYDICLISNYKKEINEPEKYLNNNDFHDENVYKYTKKTMDLMHGFIKRYAAENRLRIIVAGCLPNPEDAIIEELFFKNLFGIRIKFIPNSLENWTTFSSILRSNLSICFNSTAGFEAFGLEKKILFCNFTGINELNPAWPGPWSFSQPSFDLFNNHLNKYLQMPDQEYKTLSKKFTRYQFGDFGNFQGYKILQKTIREECQF